MRNSEHFKNVLESFNKMFALYIGFEDCYCIFYGRTTDVIKLFIRFKCSYSENSTLDQYMYTNQHQHKRVNR